MNMKPIKNKKAKGCIALVLVLSIGAYTTYQWTKIATATNYASFISTIKKSNSLSLSSTTTNYGLLHSSATSVFKIFPEQLLGNKNIQTKPVIISMTTRINSINPFNVKSKTTFNWTGVTARQLINDLSYSDISYRNNGKSLDVVSSNNEITLPFELNTEDKISLLHGSTSSMSFDFYDINYTNSLAQLTKVDLSGASIRFMSNSKYGYDNSIQIKHADIQVDGHSLLMIDNVKATIKEIEHSIKSSFSLSNFSINLSSLGVPIAQVKLDHVNFSYLEKPDKKDRSTYITNFSAAKFFAINAPLGIDQLSDIKINGQLLNINNDTLSTTIEYLTSPRAKNLHTVDSLVNNSPFSTVNEPVINGTAFIADFNATTATGIIKAKWSMDIDEKFLNIAMTDHTAFLKDFRSVVSIVAPMNVAKQFVPFSDLMELNKQNKLMISDHNGNKLIKSLISYKNGKITYSK